MKNEKEIIKALLHEYTHATQDHRKHAENRKLGYKKGSLPMAEKLASKVLALPHHQNLSKEQILYVCKKINNFYN